MNPPRPSAPHRVHVLAGGPSLSGYPDLVPEMPLAEFEFDIDETDALRDAIAPAIAYVEQQQRASRHADAHYLVTCVGVGQDRELMELGQGLVISADGRARLSLDRSGESFGDLVRAYELGLFEQDPRAVRVWLGVPTAGVGGAAWDAFRAAFETIWPTVEVVGTGYAASQALQRIGALLRSGAEVLLRHREDLEQRGFAPADAVRLAHARPWSADSLARALGVPREDAVTIFQGLDFVRGDDGLWLSPQGASSKLIEELFGVLTGYEAAVGNVIALRRGFNEVLSRADANPSS